METSGRTTARREEYDRLIAAARGLPEVPTVVVQPCEETALKGAVEAAAARMILPSFVGPKGKIRNTAEKIGVDMLAKNLTRLSNADAAGIVLGARVPIILTSRADDVRTRLASCAVAALYAHSLGAKQPVRS